MTATPARLYRDAVRALLTQYRATAGRDPEGDFRRYLESMHAQASSTSDADRLTRFVVAAGLLSYGQLDAVDELLTNIPEGRGSVRQLALAAVALFPVPANLDPYRDTDTLRAWLNEHRERLQWDAAAGKFVLSLRA